MSEEEEAILSKPITEEVAELLYQAVCHLTLEQKIALKYLVEERDQCF